MIASINKTKEILNKYNLHAKKGFGQNFLINSSIVKRIVSEAGIDKTIGVIEIGPGIGSLTEELAKCSNRVLCYEIDHDMVKILEENLSFDNIKIIEKDFLKADIKEDIKYFEGLEEIKVVSNLPYYITTPIIFKLLELDLDINDFYFMVQKEVGERFTGTPKTKDYNSLTVAINFQAEANIKFNVSRESFYPNPNVDSVIINVKKVKKDYSVNNKANFLKFVQNIFLLRRKTLVNNISSAYGISKSEIGEKLKENGFLESVRSEELTIEDIVKLYKIFRSKDEN